jgi:two-component system response regulator HydG
MFEDAMFGHTRGAFTGAMGDHTGYLTEAHRGTIFLDEIGGLSLAPQAALLRAVETKRFRPIGSRHDQTSDFRVVSATNVPLDVLASRSTFRADLIERLRGARIELPPLAERGDDSLLLAAHFAAGSGHVLSLRAERLIREYSWPGNVRQLRNAVEYATVVQYDRGEIFVLALREYIDSVSSTAAQQPSAGQPILAASFRDRRLLEVLSEVRGDVSLAAEILGVHRATMYRRLRKLADQRGTADGRGAYRPPQDRDGTTNDEGCRTRVSQSRATERDRRQSNQWS